MPLTLVDFGDARAPRDADAERVQPRPNAKHRRRWRGLAVILATMLAMTLEFACGPAANAEPVAVETEFVRLANTLRVGLNLRPLVVDPELTDIARKWSTKMAEQGDIFHNQQLGDDVKANWAKLGENVGVGDDLSLIQGLWEKSPAHYRNMVDPAFEFVGVGVVEVEGTIYVTTDFEKRQPGRPPRLTTTIASSPSATTAAPQPTSAPTIAGPDSVSGTGPVAAPSSIPKLLALGMVETSAASKSVKTSKVKKKLRRR